MIPGIGFRSLLGCVLVAFRQDGSDYNDEFFAAAIGNDGSVVMAGYTEGNWSTTNAGDLGTRDFAAAKIDADGVLIWKWQVIPHYQ